MGSCVEEEQAGDEGGHVQKRPLQVRGSECCVVSMANSCLPRESIRTTPIAQ